MGIARTLPIFLLVLSETVSAAGPMVREGEIWRVYRGSSMPPDQGTNNWTQPLYNHSTWEQLASGFGYGDGDDNTILTDMMNSYVSVFSRKRMVLTNVAEITHLTLAVDYDDGFVAFLNGVEVARSESMPPGPISNTTTANVARGSSWESNGTDAGDREYFTIDPALLFIGTNNVLAVSGHNISTTSTDFSLIVELYTNVNLIRGPFLQMPDTNGITVVWRTDAATDTVLDYGLDSGYGLGTISNGALVRDHVVALAGLPPGTDFVYRIRSAGVTLAQGVTGRARAAASQPFRFAVLGDFGVGSSGMSNVAARINATNADFLITVGDNIYYSGEPGYYDPRWFGLYAPTMRRSATFPALGNHDSYLNNRRWMATNFWLPHNGPTGHEELIYSYDFGNAHFAVIDSHRFDESDTAAMAATKTWLTNDLATTTQQWKFVAYHHPPYTSEGGHPDHESMKAEISPLLAQYGVHMAFQGHSHFYERINPINGVYYLTSGGGGQSLSPITQKSYSAAAENSINSFALVDINGTELNVRGINDGGVQFDSYSLDIGHPFLMDGLLDDSAWGRATNGLILRAAIRKNYLYVAMQDAGEGSDHFLYLATSLSTQRPANWAKSGTIMQWSAFLADENDNAFNAWIDATGAGTISYPVARSITSGLNNNGTNGNGVMEGTIDLVTYLGSFPQQIYLAGAPYTNSDGGGLVAQAQVPAGNGSANISTGEFLSISTRELALDLPVADAGSNQAVEAGMSVLLDSSGSAAPSGYALSRSWTQENGPPGVLASPTSIITSFQLTNDVPGVTNIVVVLTVNDTRFDSTDTVVVTVSPVMDSDGDGLSDQEETTGANNPLTFIDPEGRTSDPLLADTDGDGMNDGSEAIAGTSPTNSVDFLKVADEGLFASSNLVIRWPSASNRAYSINTVTNLLGALPVALFTNISATPPLNAQTVPVEQAGQQFFYIEVEQ